MVPINLVSIGSKYVLCGKVILVILKSLHYVKSIQIRENTDQKKLRIWTFFAHCCIWHWKKWTFQMIIGTAIRKNWPTLTRFIICNTGGIAEGTFKIYYCETYKNILNILSSFKARIDFISASKSSNLSASCHLVALAQQL